MPLSGGKACFSGIALFSSLRLLSPQHIVVVVVAKIAEADVLDDPKALIIASGGPVLLLTVQ
jgi:molybdopterin biosynthesis enzyme